MWDAHVSRQYYYRITSDISKLVVSLIFNMTMKKRLIISLIGAIPLVSNMLLAFNGHMIGGEKYAAWFQLLFGSVAYWGAGLPYLKSAWAAFKNHRATMDTLIGLGTSISYGYSLLRVFEDPMATYFETVAVILSLVLLGALLEERMKSSASTAVEKLMDLQAKDAEVLRNGNFLRLPIESIVPGDTVRVRPGEKVATDGKIIEGKSFLDESMVTGEAMPVTKMPGDSVIGATINHNGTFLFKVTKVGTDTVLSHIAAMVKEAQHSRAPIQKTVDKLTTIFVPLVLVIAIVTFLTWFVFVGSDFATALEYSVAVLIIACPCALGIATPTALLIGTGRAAKLGILIKNAEVLESIHNIRTVILDKTGTITVGKPRVTDVIPFKGYSTAKILSLASGLEALSEHPLAKAIIAKAEAEQIKPDKVENFDTIPGKGVTALINGKPAFVGNDKLADDFKVNLDFRNKMETLQSQAKTVVIVGYDYDVIAIIGIQDTPKSSSKKAVKTMHKAGFKTVMLTGDNTFVAKEIATEVGIKTIFADLLPCDKSKTVARLQENSATAFVGDGINDAPALSTATVGIAMGSGSDIAIESGDIILVKNDLMSAVTALVLAKKIYNRIIINLFWAFIYNIVSIPIAAGVFSTFGITLVPEIAGLAMALSSITVVTSSLLLNRVTLPVKSP